VIDSYTSIVLERLPKVIPKCEMSYFAHVQRPERIRILSKCRSSLSGQTNSPEYFSGVDFPLARGPMGRRRLRHPRFSIARSGSPQRAFLSFWARSGVFGQNGVIRQSRSDWNIAVKGRKQIPKRCNYKAAVAL
jgi:hypothetical protein